MRASTAAVPMRQRLQGRGSPVVVEFKSCESDEGGRSATRLRRASRAKRSLMVCFVRPSSWSAASRPGVVEGWTGRGVWERSRGWLTAARLKLPHRPRRRGAAAVQGRRAHKGAEGRARRARMVWQPGERVDGHRRQGRDRERDQARCHTTHPGFPCDKHRNVRRPVSQHEEDPGRASCAQRAHAACAAARGLLRFRQRQPRVGG